MNVEASEMPVQTAVNRNDEHSALRAFQRLRADLDRYYSGLENPHSRLARAKTVLGTEAIWAIALYRFGQYLQREAPAVVALLLRIPFSCAMRRRSRRTAQLRGCFGGACGPSEPPLLSLFEKYWS